MKAAQVTAERGSKSRVQDMSRVKLLKQRPEHLRKREARVVFNDSDSDEDFLDIKTVSSRRPAEQEPVWEEQEAVGEEQQLMVELLELDDVVEEQQDTADTPPRRGGLRPRVNRKRYDSSSDGGKKQSSPQQRKRRQSAAKYQKPDLEPEEQDSRS